MSRVATWLKIPILAVVLCSCTGCIREQNEFEDRALELVCKWEMDCVTQQWNSVDECREKHYKNEYRDECIEECDYHPRQAKKCIKDLEDAVETCVAPEWSGQYSNEKNPCARVYSGCPFGEEHCAVEVHDDSPDCAVARPESSRALLWCSVVLLTNRRRRELGRARSSNG